MVLGSGILALRHVHPKKSLKHLLLGYFDVWDFHANFVFVLGGTLNIQLLAPYTGSVYMCVCPKVFEIAIT